MRDVVFLTGVTGFLGTELASRLARQEHTTVYALVRASDDDEAVHRLGATRPSPPPPASWWTRCGPGRRSS